MKKKILTLFLSAIFLLSSLILLSCGEKKANDSASTKNMIDEIWRLYIAEDKGISYISETTDDMYYFDNDVLSGKYGGISSSPLVTDMESYAAFYSFENYGAEYGIFRMKSADLAKEMKSFIESRIAAMLKNAVNYPSLDTTLLKNAVIKLDGKWVYYIMSDNNEKLGEIIEKYMYEET
ncbi:MAG: DUF4358 domain-containing protein [Clostridia bacterium]